MKEQSKYFNQRRETSKYIYKNKNQTFYNSFKLSRLNQINLDHKINEYDIYFRKGSEFFIPSEILDKIFKFSIPKLSRSFGTKINYTNNSSKKPLLTRTIGKKFNFRANNETNNNSSSKLSEKNNNSTKQLARPQLTKTIGRKFNFTVNNNETNNNGSLQLSHTERTNNNSLSNNNSKKQLVRPQLTRVNGRKNNFRINNNNSV
jgi:hypothetical protein